MQSQKSERGVSRTTRHQDDVEKHHFREFKRLTPFSRRLSDPKLPLPILSTQPCCPLHSIQISLVYRKPLHPLLRPSTHFSIP